MSDIFLMTGFKKVDSKTLTDDQKRQITDNIGIFLESISSISNIAGHGAGDKIQLQSLCFTASFLAEVAGELNGLLQT